MDQEEVANQIYLDLRRIALGFFRGERANHTLQPTALVHEAFLRLYEQSSVDWRNPEQVVGVAGKMMRRVLVDHARTRRYAKRGGGMAPAPLEAAEPVAVEKAWDLELLDNALEELAKIEPNWALIVDLRYFAGFSNDEIAVALGISEATVGRWWRAAKAWLLHSMTAEAAHGQI